MKHWKVTFTRGARGTDFIFVNASKIEEVRTLASWTAYTRGWRKWTVASITEVAE